MARRTEPDPLAVKIGARVRALRKEQGLTLEGLAFSCDFSKGQLSTIEKGLAVPTASTLVTLAEGLGLDPLYLICFPEDDDAQKLIDKVRSLPAAQVKAILRLIERP